MTANQSAAQLPPDGVMLGAEPDTTRPTPRQQPREPRSDEAGGQNRRCSPFSPELQKKLEQAREQVKAHQQKNRAKGIPAAISGYYFVTSDGRVVQFSGTEKNLQAHYIALSQFDADAGHRVGDLAGKAFYQDWSGVLVFYEKIKVDATLEKKYAGCKDMFGPQTPYQIDPFVAAEQPTTTDYWKAGPKFDSVCTVVRIHPLRCKVVGCDKNEAVDPNERKMLITTDRERALRVAESRRALAVEGAYEAAVAELRHRAKQQREARANDPPPDYFDPNGACAPLSCAEEDINQYIIDEYW